MDELKCEHCEETERIWKRDFLVICILGLLFMTFVFVLAVKNPDSYRIKIVKEKCSVCTHSKTDRLD